MRCSDVTRELSVPSGRFHAEVIRRHVAACPRCASWSADAARLDRIWQATRLDDPPPGAWEALWARASEAVETEVQARSRIRSSEPAVVEPISAHDRSRSWRLGAVALIGLAQAAAVLIAVFLATSRFDQAPPLLVAHDPEPAVPAPGDAHDQTDSLIVLVEVPFGGVPLIHMDDNGQMVKLLVPVSDADSDVAPDAQAGDFADPLLDELIDTTLARNLEILNYLESIADDPTL